MQIKIKESEGNRNIHRALQLLLIIVVTVAALLCSPENVFAESSGTCGDGLTWVLSDDGKLEISGSGNLSGASWDEKSVLQVSIPAGVTSIEEGFFMGCSNLVSINVSSSNSKYASVDGVLLSKDKTVLVEFPAGQSGAYTIPGTVKKISIGAFASCKKVTSVTMPDSVTDLGKYAFNCCEGLTKVVISKNIEVIPRDCFSNCSGLKSVTIPEGVKKIEESAFWGCSSLTKVTLPKSLDKKGIAQDAFEGCPLDESSQAAVNERLKIAAASEYELEVGESRDYHLESTLDGGMIDNYFYAESSDTSVIKVASLTRTGSIVYANAVKYYYVLGVKAIGPGKAVVTVYTDNTKKEVLSKTTLTVTGEVTDTVDEKPKATAEVYKLKVGESRDYRFKSTISGGIIENPFYAVSSDTSVIKVASLTRNGNIIYADAVEYYYILGVKATGSGKAVVTVYTDKTKKKVLSKTTFTVTRRTVTNGNGIYNLSGSTASLLKPKNKNITKLSIPASVTVNGKKYKVTSVSAKACTGLKKLKSLTIGANVRSIGTSAFQGCGKLKTITIKTTKLTSKNVKTKAFKGTSAKATVKVPKKVKKAYKKWLVKKGISKKAKIK